MKPLWILLRPRSSKPVQSIPFKGLRENADNLGLGNDVYGIIEINHSGERLFTSEVEELIEEVEETESESKDAVLSTLKSANYIIAVQVLWGPRRTEETLGKLDPLWNWLSASRRGLVQQTGRDTTREESLFSKSNSPTVSFGAATGHPF